MKKSRFIESQIVSILKEADAGQKVDDVCREYGINTGLTTTGNPSMVVWKSLTLNV